MEVEPVQSVPVSQPIETPREVPENSNSGSSGTTPAPPEDSQKIVDFYA